MTVYSRTIGRVASVVSMPAWRQAMTSHDTLYNVSAAPPSQANSKLLWPHGIVRPWGFHGDVNYGWDIMSGYSSGVLIEELGAFGTMVYGSGGHTRLQNQILSVSISDDAPTFDWFQQPYFEASAVNDAELYYNRAEFDALPAHRKTGNGWNTEKAMTNAWIASGGGFPMGYEGWIFPRKLVYGQLGNNNPHGFRYVAPNYVPPSMTGTGAGAYVVVECLQGPFAVSWQPIGSTVADMVDLSTIWPSGRRKWPVWCKDVKTGVWKRLNGFQPDYRPYGIIRQHTAVARDQKRVYVSVDVANGTAAYWYIDFTNGIVGATISDLISPRTEVAPNRGTTGAFTAGHPDGRHLWYWPDLLNPAGLIMQDLDSGTQTRLSVGHGLNISKSEQPGMQYDAENNRILILQSGVLKYRWVSIPSDPLNAAGYAVSAERRLATDSSVATPVTPSGFYGKTRLHAQLGVMFVPQNRGPMLAFRPAA